jgi:hypothetical protein
MSTLLFLFEVAGFCLVAHWAFMNERPGAKRGFEGVLGMVEPTKAAVAAVKARSPSWRKSVRQPAAQRARPAAAKPLDAEAAPNWKRPLDPSRIGLNQADPD